MAIHHSLGIRQEQCKKHSLDTRINDVNITEYYFEEGPNDEIKTKCDIRVTFTFTAAPWSPNFSEISIPEIKRMLAQNFDSFWLMILSANVDDDDDKTALNKIKQLIIYNKFFLDVNAPWSNFLDWVHNFAPLWCRQHLANYHLTAKYIFNLTSRPSAFLTLPLLHWTS